MLVLLQYIRITRYFREKYPAIWSNFRFSGNGWWVEAKNEASELIAQQLFRDYLKSEARVKLNDAQLDQMVSISRALNYCAGILIVIVVTLWAYKEWFNG